MQVPLNHAADAPGQERCSERGGATRTVRIFSQKETPVGLPETRALTFTQSAYVSLRRNVQVRMTFERLVMLLLDFTPAISSPRQEDGRRAVAD